MIKKLESITIREGYYGLIIETPLLKRVWGFFVFVTSNKDAHNSCHKDDLYDWLWPGEMSYDGNNKPYERQISDHKRKLIAQIRKGIAGKLLIGMSELETLIFTRPKIGYMLNVSKQEVVLIP